jgi:lysozyme
MEGCIPRKYEEVAMITQELIDSIKLGEGFSRTAYRCSLDKLTLGFGRCIDSDVPGAGITEEEAEYLLTNDIERFAEAAERVVGAEVWSWLSQRRRDVLTELAFNMGPANLGKFKNMLAAIESEDFGTAADELLDSRYARQVGQRAERLAARLRG